MQPLNNIKWLLPITLIAGLILFYTSSLNELISFQFLHLNYSKLKTFADHNIIVSFIIFIFIYILIVAFSIPLASLITIGGGAIFGWHAFYIILFAATIGSTIVFIASKTIFFNFFKNRTNKFYKKLEKGFQKNALLYLMSLRLIPLAPFWVVNVIPAFFNMKLGSYIIGTFFGIMPGTFVYVWFAIGVEKIIIEGIEPSFSIFDHPNILGSFIALSLFILLPIIFKKKNE